VTSRLRASMVVLTVDPDDAVAEGGATRRRPPLRPDPAADPHRRSVWHRRYHRLFAAAEEHISPGPPRLGTSGPRTTTSGYRCPISRTTSATRRSRRPHVVSLVSEGVLTHADLRVALWNVGSRGCRAAVALRQGLEGRLAGGAMGEGATSVYVRRHVRATTAPTHLPTDQPAHVRELIDMVGAELADARE